MSPASAISRWAGYVALLGSLLVGSILGIIIGSHLMVQIPDHILRPILAATLAVAGRKLAL